MTSTPPVYQTMISPRSRRLRTTGLVLLVAAVAMALYGLFVLMPSLKRAVAAESRQVPSIHKERLTTATNLVRTPSGGTSQAARIRRAHHVVAVKVLFAYGYWITCGLLVVAMVFVAWLDLREVSLTYLNHRRAVWADTAASLEEKKGMEDDG